MKLHKYHNNLLAYLKDMYEVGLPREERRRLLIGESFQIWFQEQINWLKDEGKHQRKMRKGEPYSMFLEHIRKVAAVNRSYKKIGKLQNGEENYTLESVFDFFPKTAYT